MKIRHLVALVVACCSMPLLASEQLAKEKACITCHQPQTKLVGPSWQDIAIKYKSVDQALISRLSAKIRSGGTGVWGQIPMPPNSHVNDEEARELVKWVLTRG